MDLNNRSEWSKGGLNDWCSEAVIAARTFSNNASRVG